MTPNVWTLKIVLCSWTYSSEVYAHCFVVIWVICIQYQCVCCVHLRSLHMYNWHLIFQHACIIFIHILLKWFTSFTYWRSLNIVAIRNSLTIVKSIQYQSYIDPICCLYMNMGVAKILERMVWPTSYDNGDTIRVTASLSLHSSQTNDNSQYWSSTALPLGSADILVQLYNALLLSAVFCWKKAVILFFAIGWSSFDCLCCLCDIVYTMLALNLHLIHQRQLGPLAGASWTAALTALL